MLSPAREGIKITTIDIDGAGASTSALRPSRHRSISNLFKPGEDEPAGWTAVLFFGAWLVPVALLVCILALGVSVYATAARPMEVSLVRVHSLSADVVHEGARETAPPPAPKPPPGALPRAFDPLSAYHQLEVLNEATPGFFRVLWEESKARLWLEVAQDDLGSEFVVSALVSRGDGTDALLHQPRTAADRTVFRLEKSPHLQGTLDLVAPQYELRTPLQGGTISEATLARAAWPGYVRTFTGTTVEGWVTRPNASAAGYEVAVADGRCDVVLWRNASDPVVQPTDGCDAYTRNQTAWLVDITPWLVTGAGVLAEPLENGRLVSARAFPGNAEVAVQTSTVEIRLSLAKLPPIETAPIARVADDRVGYWNLHFTEVGSAATGELSRRTTNRQVDVIQRWRLEPLDPTVDVVAEVVAGRTIVPAKPITYHIDPSVPERWRAAMRRGVEAWRPAFEQAGWRDAIRAIAPGDADWPADYSAGDMRFASISWAISTERVYAVGPHTFDPRSGEILDADIMFAHSWVDAWISGFEAEAGGAGAADAAGGPLHAGGVLGAATASGGRGADRLARRLQRAQRAVEVALGEGGKGFEMGSAAWRDVAAGDGDGHGGGHSPGHVHRRVDDHDHGHGHSEAAHPGPCGVAAGAQARASIGTLRAKLALDGVIGPGDAVPAEYIEAGLVDVTMHEVGHTLGLRHNFRASAAYSFSQLSNASFTSTHGFASSVMDYVGPFLPSSRALAVVGTETDKALLPVVKSEAPGDAADGGAAARLAVPLKTYNPFPSGVGIYDRHAIEYGYSVLKDEISGRPHPWLAALAAQGSANRELAFATDEDGPRTEGADPHTSLYDMSDDPLGFHQDSLALAQRLLAGAADRAVLEGESWTRLQPSVEQYVRAALRAGSYAAKYIGGFSFSKAHRGDVDSETAAQAAVAPVPAAEQWRALRLILQILSDDFWLPATTALRSLPQRTGVCKGLDRYCYGVGPAKMLSQVHQTRVLLLHTLIQPHRLAGLQQAEWEAIPPAGEGVTDAASEWDVAWLTPPAPLDLSAFTSASPSVSSLLRATHAVISDAGGASTAALAPADGSAAADAKARRSLQRTWVSILADLSDGTGEAAAVATSLLRGLRRRTTAELDKASANAAVDEVDALEALAHMLDLWDRGLPVPE